MPSLLRQRSHIGKLGSLKDVVARAVQDPTALFVSRNTFHDVEGAISKRLGYTLHAQVADADEVWCPPVLTRLKPTEPGNLRPDVLYYFRYTYVTAAGETDDLHSSGPSSPGPAEATAEMSGGLFDTVRVSVPFHMKGVTVAECEAIDDTTVRFRLDQTVNSVCDEDVFNGWLVYSRSPRKQDESHLGYNCSATEPLYHRHQKKTNGIVGKIASYDQATGWFTLDRYAELGGSPHPDENTIDIMMPDRNGLPIRYYNVYISSDRKNFYYAGTGVSGTSTIDVTDHDETQKKAPSGRVPRIAPTVTAVDVTEDPRDGRCGEWPVLTNISPGMHSVRLTFLADSADVMRPPGLQEAQALLGEPAFCYPMAAPQETWPTCRAVVCVEAGQGIKIEPQEWPDDEEYSCSWIDWRIYTTEIEPFGMCTMNGGLGTGDMDLLEDPQRPWASYFPDRDRAVTDPNVVARLADYDTFPPMGDGVTNGSGGTNDLAYEGFRTGPANACTNSEVDPFSSDWGLNRPSYEDVSIDEDVLDPNGDIIFSYVSSRDDSAVNRFDFSFWLGEVPTYTDATHAVFTIRIRVQNNGSHTLFRPALAGETVTISYYDYQAATPVILKQGGFSSDNYFHTYTFCVEDPVGTAKTFNGEQYVSIFCYAESGTPIDVDEVRCWLYNIEGSCEQVICTGSGNDRGTYDIQTNGGDPDYFGAWYSGDTDLLDAQIEALVTEASLETLAPWNARNSPQGYEEYGNTTNVPGAVFEPISVNVTMGSVTPGEVSLPHTPASYPGITYANFTISGGYTQPADFILDVFSGTITSVTIPDGTALTITYDLNRGSWTTTQSFDDLTDGWSPSYPDVYQRYKDYRCENEYMPLWASTRPNVAVNRQHWWMMCSPTADAAYIRVTIRFRTKDGGTGGLGAWDAGTDTSRKIRLWDQITYDATGVVADSWIVLESEVGGPDILNEWVTRSYAIPYADYRHTFTNNLTGGLPAGDYKYFILDMSGWDYNGFDVDYVQIELVSDIDDPVPEEYELLRDVVPRGTEDWTLKNPMIEKPRMTATANWGEGTCPDYFPIQGEWVPIRRNTTAQWTVSVKARPVVHGAGNAVEALDNFVGCADSVFEDNQHGTLDRVFHVEGDYHGKVMCNDWRFTGYLSRIFFSNPGYPKWNFRYDGVQTFPMGIGWPYTKEELDDGLVDENGNYNPPGNDDDASTDDGACFTVGEQPAASSTSVSQIDTEEGDVPEGDETSTPVTCHDVEYYIVWSRVITSRGRSYIVRSRPRLLTETINVCIHPTFLPTVRIEAEFCPEPQVTHFEIYRNWVNSAQYYRVAKVPVDASMLDDSEMSIHFTFEDTIPESGEDLGLPMVLETGRPRAAKLMEYHNQRVWIVSQEQQNDVDFTNITSPSDDFDPEGWWPLNVKLLPMPEVAAVTALTPYGQAIIAHSHKGMVALRGVSDDINDGSGIAATGMMTHIGFGGPDAYCRLNYGLVGMSQQGPVMVLGDEGKVFGTEDIDLEPFVLNAEMLYRTCTVHHRTQGVSQVLFTYTDDPNIPPGEKALVFDSSSDESEQSPMFWKKWDSLPCYSVTQARQCGGVEYPLMGDTRGRLFAYGTADTDAGLFIEAEIATSWFDEGEEGRSHQPDLAFWRIHGHIDSVLYLDVHKDGIYRPMDMAGIPIRMGGYFSDTEEFDEPQYERRVWSEWDAQAWGDGGYWREEDKDYDEVTTDHRGIFRTIQFRLYQTRDLLPAGVDPSMNFSIIGFLPFSRLHAPTPTMSGV